MSVTKLNGAAMQDLIDSATFINNATLFTLISDGIVKNSSKALEDIKNINEQIENRLALSGDELPELNSLKDVALDHAKKLRYRVSFFIFLQIL